MMRHTKWLSATLAIALMASTAAAADTVASGKVKSINADNKTFVLTDSADKDHTFKLGDNLVVNRAGKESKSDLKAGDAVNVCYDKGLLHLDGPLHPRAGRHVQGLRADSRQRQRLRRGQEDLTFTNEAKKDSTYSMGKALVRVNMEDAKIDNVKIGDHALIIVDTVKGTPTLRSVMVDRAK